VILGVRAPGCVAAIQRLPARVRGAVRGQVGDFPLGEGMGVCAGPGVRASAASPSHRVRRRGGRAGCGAEEETDGERREGENDTRGPPVIEKERR
jgi:hypothetical protein